MMSASPSIDAYDAQMLDFSLDPDVPMHITGSAEFFAEALMDHDDHLVTSAYGGHPSVEVDMEEYVGDNAEYEMADETAEFPRPRGDELLDIEVYDASHVPSPLVPPQPLQPPVDVPIDSGHSATASPSLSEHPTLPELESGVHPASLDQPAVGASHEQPSATGEVATLEVAASESPHPPDNPDGSVPPNESREKTGDSVASSGQLLGASPSADAADKAEPRVSPVGEEQVANSGVVQQEHSVEDARGTATPVQDEKATVETPETEEESVDPLHISDGVYIDPPPTVLLSVADLSEPEFALFNSTDVDGESTGQSTSNRKVYSLLLENRPTLYYEPLSSVFEALRQDEDLLSRIPHSFEGELVLDAYDLQLAISEDNVHSREISLHDLNILHDGSNFVGPLRLSLRAIVPRFIIRYYALQEQTQRLHVAAGPAEGEHNEEHSEQRDNAEEQSSPQPEEAADQFSGHAAVVSGGSELPPITETEESNEESAQKSYEQDDASAAREPSAEYHEVTGEATHALEDENNYDDTNASEDEPPESDRLDADQVHHAVAEDTDAPATANGQRSELGSEQTEYSEYVQPEYDELYGEDLPERAGGASPVQYGEPAHYEEEEGRQGTSTAVDETPDLPGSADDEDNESAATPIPPRVVLEPESSAFADDSTTGESVLPKGENPASSKGELVTSEFTGEVDHESGDEEPSTLQTRIFSEVEESDSNFILMLEREADAEFDQTFEVKQSTKEGSAEATSQHVETWDEDEWDDEDAEGVNEEDWIDPDADSNESSNTLSSKSSKRSFDDIDPSEELCVEISLSSPGSKRPRVQ